MSDAEAAKIEADSDRFLGDTNPIWNDKSLLKIDRMVEGERIVAREDELERLVRTFSPALHGQSPANIVIYGRTGSGKSLVAKYASKIVLSEAKKNPDLKLDGIVVDCTEDVTELSVIKTMARNLNDESVTDVSIPDTGISASLYKKRLWKILNEMGYDSVFLILDELDRNKEDSQLLGTLSRAGEDEKIDTNIGLVVISNKTQWAERLNDRTGSSLQQTKMRFNAYDAGGLRKILNARDDAFCEGVLSGGAIPLAAGLAANEHGDARRAMNILRNAGDIAVERGSEQVTEEHVRLAGDTAELDEVEEVVESEVPQGRALMYALTLLDIYEGRKSKGYATGEVYGVYRFVCDETGTDSLSDRRVRDILQTLNYNEIIRSEKVSRGRGKGITWYHTLRYDPEVVQRAFHNHDEAFVFDDHDDDAIELIVQAQINEVNN